MRGSTGVSLLGNRSMASDLGFNSYKRYKAGTARFASWLAEVGKSCGESIEDIASASSQSKRTSQGKKTGKKKSGVVKPLAPENTYTIPIRHFIGLANAVVSSKNPEIIVPSSIFTLLCDVISLRKEVSQILGQPDDGQPDGHNFFIAVLERVKEILRPSTEKAFVKDDDTLETPEQRLGNIFEALELEESQDFIESNSTPRSMQTSQKAVSKQTYDIERTHDEILLSSLFFFHDLNRIRELVRVVWTDYSQATADLSTASLVTNTAIEIIRRNLEDHLATMVAAHGAPKEEDWIFWVYCHICHGVDVSDRELPEDQLNYATYYRADYVCLRVFENIKEFMETLPSHQLQFICGHDRNADYSELPRERDQAERLFLNLLLSDLHNLMKFQMIPGPAMDDITRAFLEEKVSETKLVPLWLGFALQIILDIRRALRNDTSQAFKELQTTGQRVPAVIRDLFQFSRSQESPRHQWHNDNDPQILKLVGFVAEWINKDQLSENVRKYAKQSPEGVELSPFFLMKQHPLLCGSLAYWLNLSLLEFSISLANAYDSILSAAHLYNAARQSGLLNSPWPDMEYIISVHTPQRIFVGGKPTQPEDFYKKFQLVLGGSVLNYARNRRVARPVESSRHAGSRRLRKNMPIHDIFRARYTYYTTRAELTDTKLDVVIAEAVSKHPEMDRIAKYASQWAKTRRLTSLQLLSILGVAIKDQDLHLHFDYISMHIRCAKLLSEMRQYFIRGADDHIQAITTSDPELSVPRYLAEHLSETSITPFLTDDATNSLLSRYLAEEAMATDQLAVRTALSIFLANPAAIAVAQKINPDAYVYNAILRYADVSLERASALMDRVIETEGGLEINKAGALCKPTTSDPNQLSKTPGLLECSDEVLYF